MPTQNTYIVSFLITQNSENVEWFEMVLRQGLNEGETLGTLVINKLNNDGEHYDIY